MTQLKLYTEEQVRKAIELAKLSHTNIETIYSSEEVIGELTPIELPSDEEIEELSVKEILYNDAKRTWWKVGAKWMIKQILNQNK